MKSQSLMWLNLLVRSGVTSITRVSAVANSHPGVAAMAVALRAAYSGRTYQNFVLGQTDDSIQRETRVLWLKTTTE